MYNMESTRRSRTTNWDEQEKKILESLIKEYADPIESKGYTTASCIAKKQAWEQVAIRFNAVNSVHRELHHIQNQWRNMKGRVKSSKSSQESDAGDSGEPMFDFVNSGDSDSSLSNRAQLKQEDPCSPPPMVVANDFLSVTFETPPNTTQNGGRRTSNIDQDYEPGPKKKKKLKNEKCCELDHEHELFLLAKKAREEAMLRDQELHQMRMKVLALEHQYWSYKKKQLQNESR